MQKDYEKIKGERAKSQTVKQTAAGV